jgi:SAM-dependent methyltransferase
VDAAVWDERYGGTEYLWAVEPNRFVAEQTLPLVPGRALDLAAGEGRNAVWLATRGWRVTAVDFSAVGMAKAERLAADHGVDVETVVADVLTHPFEEDQWDLVVVAYLQLAEPARRAVITRAGTALAPGGTIVIVAHDLDNLEQGWGGPQSPEVLYRAEETAAWLEGLDVVVQTVVGRVVPGEEEDHVALDTLVVARR